MKAMTVNGLNCTRRWENAQIRYLLHIMNFI